MGDELKNGYLSKILTEGKGKKGDGEIAKMVWGKREGPTPWELKAVRTEADLQEKKEGVEFCKPESIVQIDGYLFTMIN